MFQGFLLEELGESGKRSLVETNRNWHKEGETQESSILLPVYWDGTKLEDKGLVSLKFRKWGLWLQEADTKKDSVKSLHGMGRPGLQQGLLSQ